MIVVDTSGLIAALFSRDPAHPAVASAIGTEKGPFVVSPFVLAEVDYLVLENWGVENELLALAAIHDGFQIAQFDRDDLHMAMQIINRYEDHGIGLADASIVVLAHRHRTRRVLTLDQRHFRVLRGPGDKPFTIVPADLGTSAR